MPTDADADEHETCSTCGTEFLYGMMRCIVTPAIWQCVRCFDLAHSEPDDVDDGDEDTDEWHDFAGEV